MTKVKLVHKFPDQYSEMIDIEDLGIDWREEGFCRETMTLLFKSHPQFNAALLPPGVSSENASTEMAITHSLAFKQHLTPVRYITQEKLNELYQVIDNPTVKYDDSTNSYYEPQLYYIERETMTGIIIGCDVNDYNQYPVYGIFAPRGYTKIECYNKFNNKYLE